MGKIAEKEGIDYNDKEAIAEFEKYVSNNEQVMIDASHTRAYCFMSYSCPSEKDIHDLAHPRRTCRFRLICALVQGRYDSFDIKR